MRKALVPLAAAILVAAALSLAGCFGMPAQKAVAARVGSDAVYESDVTDYIEGFRSNNPSYETDSGWAQFLNENGMTAESMREYVLKEVFVPKVLIRQQCDIVLTDNELDQVISREQAFYEQRYGKNSWDSVLSSYGYTEQTWRQNEADRLLEQQLESAVIADATPSQSEVQLEANEHASDYNGKHSYFQSFANEQEATEAQSRLSSLGASLTLEQFRSVVGDVQNAGWSSLKADQDNMSKEYVQALNGLGAGQVSAPVQQDDAYLLIFCDQVLDIPEKGDSVDFKALPAEIQAQLTSDAEKSKRTSLFNDWMKNLMSESDIEYEPMPEGLPYDVNVSISD
ncbi:MAG: SurA N-terminal domain-containing protein [Coriobacteriales bacterium]